MDDENWWEECVPCPCVSIGVLFAMYRRRIKKTDKSELVHKYSPLLRDHETNSLWVCLVWYVSFPTCGPPLVHTPPPSLPPPPIFILKTEVSRTQVGPLNPSHPTGKIGILFFFCLFGKQKFKWEAATSSEVKTCLTNTCSSYRLSTKRAARWGETTSSKTRRACYKD